MTAFWTLLTTLITNMITGITSIADGVLDSDILAIFVFAIPLFALILRWMLKLIGGRRSRR